MLETDRLILRAYQRSDLEPVLALFNNVQVTLYLLPTEYIVPHGPKYEENIARMVENCLMYCVVIEKATKDFVGITLVSPIQPKNRDAELGISLLPEHWNQGYGTEIMRFLVGYSFRDLAMHRVSITVIGGNIRAISLYKKLGFIEEGRRRQNVWVDGEWRDTILMGILEDEWRLRKRIVEGTSKEYVDSDAGTLETHLHRQ